MRPLIVNNRFVETQDALVKILEFIPEWTNSSSSQMTLIPLSRAPRRLLPRASCLKGAKATSINLLVAPRSDARRD